jgi:hypothetical protein
MRPLLLGLFLAATAHANPDLDVAGLDDDVVGAGRLVAWCKVIGLEARLGEKSAKAVFLPGERLTLAPRLTKDSVDRLVVYNFYEGKPGNRENAALRLLVAKVNREYNVCTLYVDGDGDLCFQYNLAFDDRLSERLLRRHLRHVNESAFQILRRHEAEFAPYLAE